MPAIAYFSRPLATVAPRDILLAERLGAKSTDAVLEIGTGSGSTLFRLAPAVSHYHGVDIAAGPVERLERAVSRSSRRLDNVRLFVADFCQSGAATTLPLQYDLVFSCDALEHVDTPAAFLANIFQALRPGGRAFVTFPNEHPSRAHGITYFERRIELQALLEAAGFLPDDIQIEELSMPGLPAAVLKVGWQLPRSVSKQAARLVLRSRSSVDAPQTFDQTDFFTMADRFERWSPMINAYCWSVLKMMDAVGPVYRSCPASETIWDKRILMTARRRDTEPA